MKAVQIVLDEPLLRAADRAAKKAKINRSAFVRDALREHLKHQRLIEREARDRKGYAQTPASDLDAWEGVASWPDE